MSRIIGMGRRSEFAPVVAVAGQDSREMEVRHDAGLTQVADIGEGRFADARRHAEDRHFVAVSAAQGLQDTGIGGRKLIARRMRQGRKVVRPQIDDDQIGTVRRRREIPRRFRRLVERIGDAVGHRILRSGVLIAVIACRAASRMGDQRIVGAEITGDDAGIRLVAVLGLRFERLVLRKPLGPVTAGQRIADKFDMPSGRGRRRQQTPSPVKQEGMDRRAPLLAFGAFLHPHGMFAAPQLLGQHLLKSGNDTVDSILNYMLHRAEALHCKTTVNILVPRDSFMNDFDLNIILSNLLDNALEALEKESERFLDIKMIYDKNVLSIHISNSFHGKIKTRLGRIQSSKKDKTLHGMGLSHVHRVVQSYGGDLHYSALDGRFTVEIILYPVTAPSLAK